MVPSFSFEETRKNKAFTAEGHFCILVPPRYFFSIFLKFTNQDKGMFSCFQQANHIVLPQGEKGSEVDLQISYLSLSNFRQVPFASRYFFLERMYLGTKGEKKSNFRHVAFRKPMAYKLILLEAVAITRLDTAIWIFT